MTDEYLELAQRVYSFNPKAGILLLFSIPYLEKIRFRCASNVNDSFIWDRTPQGYRYWGEIEVGSRGL